MRLYYRPVAMTDAARPPHALPLAGGWCWFDHVEVLSRSGSQGVIPVRDMPAGQLQRLTAARPPLAGLSFDRPRVMGILNVTPDSFSDGGRFLGQDQAITQALALAADADLLDVGGESTRPGAADVSETDEIARTAPVISTLRQRGCRLPISVDTRKARVAAAALDAGADMVNDVAALGYDRDLAALVAARRVPLCLMHAQGAPATMQADPRYDDVLLDVYDYLEGRVAAAEAAGIPRSRILIDPGIGFGKTAVHNLTLLASLSLFHGIGCPILLGVSRKRFIGTIGGAEAADRRGPGTIAVTLAAVAQGVQVHRVHDAVETRQALNLWSAVTTGKTKA